MRHQCDVSEPGRGDAGFHRLLIFEDDGDRAVGVAPALALAVLSQQRPCSIGDLVRGDDTVRELESVKTTAGQSNFDVGSETGTGEYEPGHLPSKEVCAAADRVFNGMKKALEMIKKDLHGGTLS